MTSPPSWLDELRLEPGPPWHAMGTRGIEAGGWRPDRDDEQLVLKAEVLAAHRDNVVVLPDDVATEAAAAARLVAAAGALALDPCMPPLESAARQVAEDLCVLAPVDAGSWRLVAGVVCFPSMWRLPDKVGLSLAMVHDPVPAYAAELAARVDRFLDRLTVERPVWRRNWFVHDRPDLFLPPTVAAPRDVRVPDGLWLRSERQSLLRMPDANAILFTIRTSQVPLGALAARPDVARRMAAVVRSWPDEIVAYRGAVTWRDELARWLDDPRA